MTKKWRTLNVIITKKQKVLSQWKYERKIGFITSGSGCQLNHKVSSFSKANQNAK